MPFIHGRAGLIQALYSEEAVRDVLSAPKVMAEVYGLILFRLGQGFKVSWL